ncbi:hypothetical protein BsWGS_23447 [Bradybaena similaris]
MRRYKSIKEDRSIPVDGVSVQDVEKDIKDLQSYIASLKAAEEVVPPSQPVRTQSYASENFETFRIADDPLLDFPPANDLAEDIKETLTQDYIKDLAALSPEEVLESRVLNAKQIERQKQISLLPDGRRQFRLLPDTSDTFDYPEHVVVRSNNRMGYHSSKNFADPISKKQSHGLYSPPAMRLYRHRHLNVQHEPHLELSTRKSVTVAKPLTKKNIENHTENPTLKMLQGHESSMKSADTLSRKTHNSEIAGLTAVSDEEGQTQNGDKNHTTSMQDVEAIDNSEKQMPVTRHRNNPGSLAKLTRKTDIVDDTEAFVTEGTTKPRHLVNVEKRRGNNRAKYAKKKTYYRRPKPPPPKPRPNPETTTQATTTSTVTTLSSTWTTEGRTMQEIVDSGSDKIDIPLSKAPSGQAIIHGRRDIVMAGGIMGSIGLLLIILSFVYMFISRRRSQQKVAPEVAKDSNKNYRRLGSAEETAKLTGSQRSLFPLSSDEDTSEESEGDSRHYQTGTKGTAH